MEDKQVVENSISDLKNVLEEARRDGSALHQVKDKLLRIKEQLLEIQEGKQAEEQLSAQSEGEDVNSSRAVSASNLDQLDKVISMVSRISFDAREIGRYSLDATQEDVERNAIINNTNALFTQILSLYSSLLSKL